jgi:tyrosyl-tRNA synthetase
VEREFDKLFRKKEVPDEVAEYVYEGENSITITRLIALVGGAASNSEARRLTEAGAVQIDSEKMTDPLRVITVDRPILLKVGKRFFIRVRPRN